MEKILILIPTYNERENISALIPVLRRDYPGLDILVIDDNSPDKTANFVKKFSRRDPKVALLLRSEKQGLGRALIAGYKYAVLNGYQKVIQLDADLSHPPGYIRDILEVLSKDSIVVLSRNIPGGGSSGWSLFRQLVNKFANLLVRTLLLLKVKDATSGFRGFPVSFLRELVKSELISSGYLIQVEVVIIALRLNYRVKEVPFIYQRRTEGVSKLDFLEALGSGFRLFGLVFKRYN